MDQEPCEIYFHGTLTSQFFLLSTIPFLLTSSNRKNGQLPSQIFVSWEEPPGHRDMNVPTYARVKNECSYTCKNEEEESAHLA